MYGRTTQYTCSKQKVYMYFIESKMVNGHLIPMGRVAQIPVFPHYGCPTFDRLVGESRSITPDMHGPGSSQEMLLPVPPYEKEPGEIPNSYDLDSSGEGDCLAITDDMIEVKSMDYLFPLLTFSHVYDRSKSMLIIVIENLQLSR